MEIPEMVEKIQNIERAGKLSKKRVTCAQCGNTWIELVGLIVGQKEGSEDLCLRIGIESENCQTCRFRPLECRKCGSKDVYEIMFTEEISKEVPLIFKDIKRVSRSSHSGPHEIYTSGNIRSR
jgi:hypothetical protein